MTNHPRSPRAKFKVGQVVADRHKPVGFHKLVTVSADGNCVKFVDEQGGEHFYGNANSYFRPLTKKEAGR